MSPTEGSSKARQSLLQTMILVSLGTHPAPTIAALAERLGKMRPAVSRSLRSLKNQGLVTRVAETGWVLTEAGSGEVENAGERLVKSATDASNDLSQKLAATGVMDSDGSFYEPIRQQRAMAPGPVYIHGLAKQFDAAVQTQGLAIRLAKQFDDAVRLPAFDTPILQLARNVKGLAEPYISAAKLSGALALPWHRSMTALVQDMSRAQEVTARLGSLLPQLEQLTALNIMSVNNAGIAGMLDDAIRIGRLDAIRIGRLADPALSQSVAPSLTVRPLSEWRLVVNRYIELQEDRLRASTVLGHLAGLRLVLPTIALGEYSSSVRHYMEAKAEDIADVVIEDEASALQIDARGLGEPLEPLLAQLDERFVAKRRGIWDALSEHNHDGPCQAAHSARELLNRILHLLAPNEALTTEKPTRRDRVKYILKSKSHAEYVDAAAFAIDKMYDRLSNIAHSLEHARWSAVAAVAVCEALVLDLLLAALDAQ